jgi:uncharacterized protein YukE
VTNTDFNGISLSRDVEDLASAIKGGSWVDGGLAGLSTSLDALGFVANPADALLSSGIAWLIEHVDILTQALNRFAGNPAAIHAYAEEWRQNATLVSDAHVELRNYVTTDTDEWHGAAADGYRSQAVQQQDGINAISGTLNSVADAVEASGQVVATGRMLTRDLIAQCVSEIVLHIPAWLAIESCSLGLGTPAVIADAVYLIAKWV